jgi:hypothetical protein
MLFLSKNNFGQITWHMAAEQGQVDILHKLWECAKEALTKEELNNKFF